MSDKKRRNRVQGSWAAPTSKAGIQIKRESPKAKPFSSPAASQSWTAGAETEHKFTYVETGQIKQERPPDIHIQEKQEDYVLSEEPSGLSRIRYYPDFLKDEDLDEMYDILENTLPWKRRSDVKHGVPYEQPRMTAWYGDLPYSYSGVILQPNPQWTPLLQYLKDLLREKTLLDFNSMLANLYRDEHDSVDWHCDNEKSLGDKPLIASLTFGEVRNFLLRKKPPPEEDYSTQQHVKIPLVPGSLLIMEGATQDDWQHSIPKEYHSRGSRINLTFRTIYPE
ncbi:alpha-ketoglutarate-dependent dioxygenase alkB homolog 3-like [Glandiceps talaboti]